MFPCLYSTSQEILSHTHMFHQVSPMFYYLCYEKRNPTTSQQRYSISDFPLYVLHIMSVPLAPYTCHFSTKITPKDLPYPHPPRHLSLLQTICNRTIYPNNFLFIPQFFFNSVYTHRPATFPCHPSYRPYHPCPCCLN